MLTFQRPYLGSALWAMQRVPRPGLGTLAVDGRWRLYFDPTQVLTWSVAELSGVLYHEVCHLLRDHADRAACADDRRIWNVATDAEINDDLLAEGVNLPDRPITPASLELPDGLLAEEYYARLRERARERLAQSHGPCGSGATGQPEAWEEAESDSESGVSRGEATLLRRLVAEGVRAHERSRGTVPGAWKQWAAQILAPPRVDWRRELASAVRGAIAQVQGATDYSYTRPSRRAGCAPGVVLPALRQPVPRVAVVVDTSGSMSRNDLGEALVELGGVLRALGHRDGVQVLTVDAAVQACQRVFRPGQVELTGGGGTDMREGLAAVERLRSRPEVVVVLTDGDTPWPDVPPANLRTIVVLVGARAATAGPAWARTITASSVRQPTAAWTPGGRGAWS